MNIMLEFDALKQLLVFLYFENRKMEISKADCYSLFIQSLMVEKYCEFEGIEIPSNEAAKHRIPFLVSLLEMMDILRTDRSNIYINIWMLLLN